MSDDDRTDRGHLQKAREEMEEKGPLEAIRDDMSDLKEDVKDAVSDDDTADEIADYDDKPTQPSLDDEPRVDEGDEGRALPGDRPSERTQSGFNRK